MYSSVIRGRWHQSPQGQPERLETSSADISRLHIDRVGGRVPAAQLALLYRC